MVFWGGLFAISFAFIAAAHSQIRLAGLAGISSGNDGSAKFTGVLNAGYEFKGVSILYDQRHQVFTGGSWFGGNAGYTFRMGNFSVRPYGGYWYKMTGNKNSTDRFIQDGNEQILSKDKPVNSKTGGYGLQVFPGKFMIDIGYHGVYSFTIGMGGLLD